METMFVKGNSFILSSCFFQLRISLTTKQKRVKMIKNTIKWQNMVFMANFWWSTCAKLLYSLPKCSLKPLTTLKIRQKMLKMQ